MKLKEIEGLIDFIAKSGLEEVNIETEQIKIRVKRNPAAITASTSKPSSATPAAILATDSSTMPGALAEAALPTSPAPAAAKCIEIKSPMVGTFYRAANPETPPFIKEGDAVSQGQTVCIIEAMKLFNEIEAEVTGTIVKVLAEDASPVEYDQPLFLVEPA